MKNRQQKKFTTISLLGLLAFAACSPKASKNSSWEPPQGKYPFVEYYITYEGTAISGNPAPGMRIDGPTYTFEPEAGQVTSYITPDFNKDSVLLVMGGGVIRRGTEGGGISSRLAGVKQLPYSQGKVTLTKLSKEGLIIEFNNEATSIPEGGTFEKILESTDTIPGMGGSTIVKRKITHKLQYIGLLSKDKLVLP